MSVWEHEDRDQPFNVADAVTLDPGEVAEVTLTVEDRLSDYFLPAVAMSRHKTSRYTIEADGTAVFGPAPLPPADPQDGEEPFTPPETFSDEVTLTVENLDASKTRTYYLQARGWERRKFPGEGGEGW